MPLNNFGLVSTHITTKLYRSAQPDAVGLADLIAMNVGTIFKLNEGNDDLDYTGVLIKRPLAGWSPWYDTKLIVGICDEIEAALQVHNVLVHCTHGRDRTGLVCAAYRLLFDKATYAVVQTERDNYGVDGLIAIIDSPENKVLEDIAAGRV
jgi:hypothetical protein